MTYTRNFPTCLDAGFNGFPDLVLMWIDKINCYIVDTVMADDGSSPMNCYIVDTVLADDGSSPVNCYIVDTVLADDGSSPMNCYIVYTVMVDDGSSSNSPVQLIQHCHFL
jgi:phosphopantetheine adenylyltransferase